MLIEVKKHCDNLISCLNTHPCAMMPRHFEYLSVDSSVVIKSMCARALGHIRSLHCVFNDLISLQKFNDLLTMLQRNSNNLDEVVIVYHKTDDLLPGEIPLVVCRRLKFIVNQFTSVFKCAYHPSRKLQSLHVQHAGSDHKLNFTKDLSDIVILNSSSLLDLRLSGVGVLKENTLLQETLMHCHTLVVLELHNTNNGCFRSAKAHELFSSLRGLLKLEFLVVSDTINVFGDDICELCHLLVGCLPKLKHFHLSFYQFIVYFTLLDDKKYEAIQALLHTILSDKEPTADCHTVAFKWRNNQSMLAWLSQLRYNANFKL